MDSEFYDDAVSKMRGCGRCAAYTECELISFMGYSLYLCRSCAAAYRNGEAID